MRTALLRDGDYAAIPAFEAAMPIGSPHADRNPGGDHARMEPKLLATVKACMRLIPLLPLVLLSACDVRNDTAGNTVTVTYDKQEIRRKAAAAGRAAREAAIGAGNVAASAGRAVKREVGDIDVDVDVKRTRTEKAE